MAVQVGGISILDLSAPVESKMPLACCAVKSQNASGFLTFKRDASSFPVSRAGDESPLQRATISLEVF
jgi:hypothetical protein